MLAAIIAEQFVASGSRVAVAGESAAKALAAPEASESTGDIRRWEEGCHRRFVATFVHYEHLGVTAHRSQSIIEPIHSSCSTALNIRGI